MKRAVFITGLKSRVFNGNLFNKNYYEGQVIRRNKKKWLVHIDGKQKNIVHLFPMIKARGAVNVVTYFPGNKISAIKKELKDISKQEEIKSARRNNSRLPQVALVGYTNAGKSTTMNELLNVFSEEASKKQVFEKNMLFATLDTSVRRIDLKDDLSFILSDTVGFISKLPHNLIESFKATLQEAKDADLIINVVDASDHNMVQMIKTTQKVLDELKITNVPMITAYNKADLTDRNYPQIEGNDILYSAKDPESIKQLADLIVKKVFDNYEKVNLVLPLSDGKNLAYLHEYGQILNEDFKDDGVHVTVRLSPKDLEKFKTKTV